MKISNEDNFPLNNSELYDLLLRAGLISINHHSGQKYGSHDYFEYHICGVVKLIKDSTYHKNDTRGVLLRTTVAYLHDILEDTNYTVEQLKNEFPDFIYEPVILLTKEKGYTLETYLERIKSNSIAKDVKIADSSFNMMECLKERNIIRYKKYSMYLDYLLDI